MYSDNEESSGKEHEKERKLEISLILIRSNIAVLDSWYNTNYGMRYSQESKQTAFSISASSSTWLFLGNGGMDPARRTPCQDRVSVSFRFLPFLNQQPARRRTRELKVGVGKNTENSTCVYLRQCQGLWLLRASKPKPLRKGYSLVWAFPS